MRRANLGSSFVQVGNAISLSLRHFLKLIDFMGNDTSLSLHHFLEFIDFMGYVVLFTPYNRRIPNSCSL